MVSKIYVAKCVHCDPDLSVFLQVFVELPLYARHLFSVLKVQR